MVFVDSDNALGSPRGDVDDAFAIAAILCSGRPVAGLSSVAGNTSEALAFENNKAIARLCGYAGPVLRGEEGARGIASAAEPLRVLALGPLTNVAEALRLEPRLQQRVTELVLVGGNAASWGRWPPLWPLEFNLTKDRAAAKVVFESDLPLTVVPLDAARRLRATRRDLAELPGPLGQHLREHSRRWFRRALIVHASRSIPLWDLCAAIYALEPGLFQVEETRARQHRNGWLEFGAGERPLRLIRDFDPQALWKRLVAMLHKHRGPASTQPQS